MVSNTKNGTNPVNVILLAAGSSTRFGEDKVLSLLNGIPVLEYSIRFFENFSEIERIYLVASKQNLEGIKGLVKRISSTDKVVVLVGGESRKESVWNGLKRIEQSGLFGLTLVHDGARPLLKEELVREVIEKGFLHRAAVPTLPVHSALKIGEVNSPLRGHISREGVLYSQTPQGFLTTTLFEAYKATIGKVNGQVFFDDAQVVDLFGVSPFAVKGDPKNIKITTKDDLDLAHLLLGLGENKKTKHGYRLTSGYDCHKLKPSSNGGVKLGGVFIPSEYKTIAHSDGDVLYHALADALFGAANAGDLGEHFPSDNESLKNETSDVFVKKALKTVACANLEPDYVDVSIVADKPRLAKFTKDIKKSVANIVGLSQEKVSIKVTGTDDTMTSLALCVTVSLTLRVV